VLVVVLVVAVVDVLDAVCADAVAGARQTSTQTNIARRLISRV